MIVHSHDDQMEVVTAGDVADLGFSPVRTQYLGQLFQAGEVIGCFSGELPDDASLPAGFAAVDLRRLAEEWHHTRFGIAGHAKQIVAWDRDHQFCSRCGERTETMRDERAKRCPVVALPAIPGCRGYHYCCDTPA